MLGSRLWAGSARGRCVRFWHTDAIHLDLPSPLYRFLQYVSDPVKEGIEREFIREIAPAPPWAGDDSPSQHELEVLQQDSKQDEHKADN